MELKKVFLVALFLLSAIRYPLSAEESGQQINDFSLSGYGDKGKKSWDIAGKSADINGDVVNLKKVSGNLYEATDNIKLTSDTGKFNKSSGEVHLEENVVITTDSGAKLTTDQLDWDRKSQLVSTPAKVNLQKEEMTLVGMGASGAPNLKKIQVDKDVRLDILPKDKQKEKDKLVVTCDGSLEVDYEKNIAIFNINVKVERPDSIIFSDKLFVYFTRNKGASGGSLSSEIGAGAIDKIVAQGNVRIIQGENISYSQEAIYLAADKKMILTGRPQLVIYQTEKMNNASFGN